MPHTQRFDYYGDKAFSAEKERLDYFASRLREPEINIGYICGLRRTVGSLLRGQFARDLSRELSRESASIKPEKIVVINGGYRGTLMVEIYAGPATWNQPLLTPTVRPSKVRIIRDNKATATLRKSLKLPRKQCERCPN